MRRPKILLRFRPGWQLRLRWIWVTRTSRTTIWAHVGGNKPLAHLPRWRRRLLHLPAIRWRLWPRPWNFNGPVSGYRRDRRRLLDQRDALWNLLHDATQSLPTDRRVEILDRAEQTLR